MLDLGMEALAFQGNSALGKAMDAMFQEVIDYRKSLAGDPGKVNKVIKFFKKTTAPKLKAAYLKYTNIEVASIIYSTAPNLGFATSMHLGGSNGWLAQDVISLYSGMGDTKNRTWDKTKVLDLNELKKIADSFDNKRGSFSYTKYRGKPITAKLYFDIFSAFLMKETIHTRLPHMTAQEITAIELHETGHMITMLEHAGEEYFRWHTFTDSVAPQVANMSSKEVRELGKYLTEKAEKNGADGNHTTAMTTLTENIATLKEETEKESNLGAFLSVIGFVAEILIRWLFYLFLHMVSGGTTTFVNFIVGFVLGSFTAGQIIRDVMDLMEDLTLWSANGNTKQGDTLITSKNMYICERYADEYVSRHGYSRPLASGLGKIFEAAPHISFGGHSAKNGKFVRFSNFCYHMVKFDSMFSTITGITDEAYVFGYEGEIDRTKRMMQNIIQLFKENSVPDELIQFYIDDYRGVEQVLVDKRSSAKFARGISKMYKFLGKFISPSHLLAAIADGRLHSDYADLQNLAEELNNNKLFLHSSKLRALGNKK